MAQDKATSQIIDRERVLLDSAVAQLLLAECTADGLVRLLDSEVGEMREAAIVCLGLKGSPAGSFPLVRLLKCGDADTVSLAENSLWRIWMQAGSACGNAILARAIELIRRDQIEEALDALEGLCAAEPGFAEAHHQLGIVRCLLDQPAEAARAFCQTLRLNRYHFSAALNLGHTCVEQDDLHQALRYYRCALRIHPGLDEIPEVVRRLEAALGDSSPSHKG